MEVKTFLYIRVGKLWSRGRANNQKISERESLITFINRVAQHWCF